MIHSVNDIIIVLFQCLLPHHKQIHYSLFKEFLVFISENLFHWNFLHLLPCSRSVHSMHRWKSEAPCNKEMKIIWIVRLSEHGEWCKTSQSNPSNFCNVCKEVYDLALTWWNTIALQSASVGRFWWIITFELFSPSVYTSETMVLSMRRSS